MSRSTYRRLSRALAGAFVAAGVSFGPIACFAQTGAAVGAKLPNTVRLRVRGKVGDVETSTGKLDSTLAIDIAGGGSNISQHHTREEHGTEASTTRLVKVFPDGAIELVMRETLKTDRKIEDGKPVPSNEPLKEWTTVLAPDRSVVKRSSVAILAPGASTKPKKATTDEDSFAPPYPDRELTVGDKWDGETLLSGKKTPYSARLAAIEMRHDMPCARIEYEIDFKSAFDALKDTLPPSSRMEITDVQSHGGITTWVRLDRGSEVDMVADVNYSATARVTVEDAASGQTGTAYIALSMGLAGNERTVRAPAYDASLIRP